MVGKPNLPSDAETRNNVMGSSLLKHGTALDQERAASMADEGGVSGALMDTREQHSLVGDEPSRQFWTWVIWSAAAAGCAALAASLILRQRARA